MDINSIKSKINFGSPKVKGIVISVVLFIAIMGIYYYFFYSGLNAKAAQEQNSLNQATEKYNSYFALAGQYPALSKRYKKLKAEFSGFLNELPSKKNIPELLMKISNYEKSLNLNLNMFKPEKGIAKGFYETVPFSMNISGNFYNVYKFFYKLAVMKRIVDAHNVSLSNAAKGGRVSVSFKGTTFSFIGSLNKAKRNKPPASAKIGQKPKA